MNGRPSVRVELTVERHRANDVDSGCACPCHWVTVIADDLRRDLAERRDLIADERTGLSRRLREREAQEKAARLEEARTGHYRSWRERQEIASQAAVDDLFGGGR